MMWHDGYGYGYGWGWAVMGVMMVVFWGLVIAGFFVVVHYLRTPGGGRSEPVGSHGTQRAQALLAERLARSEIDEDEYRRRSAVL
ncbi:SHOCT domain-containing protein, partial [Nocardia gipuzkoensis]